MRSRGEGNDKRTRLGTLCHHSPCALIETPRLGLFLRPPLNLTTMASRDDLGPGPGGSNFARRVTGEGQKKKSTKKDQHRKPGRTADPSLPDRKKVFKAVLENPLQVEW
jgi:hypothetical protein